MDIRPGDLISPLLLDGNVPLAEAESLFKRYVRVVALEIFSYCNRRCAYCPVSKVDRLTGNSYMNDGIFDRVLLDLNSIDYSQGICLNIYNEPMADPILYERIETIRDRVSKSRIYFNTNGDYLNPSNLEQLEQLGVDRIVITIHPGPGKEFSDTDILSRFTELALRIGKKTHFRDIQPGTHYSAVTNHKSLNIRIISTNYMTHGDNRAGTVDVALKVQRTWPCRRPFSDFTVYHDGSVFPCCQFFPELGGHDAYRVGYVDPDRPIFPLYGSPLMAGFRKGLFAHGLKLPPCDTCSEAPSAEGQDQIKARKDMQRELERGSTIDVESFEPGQVGWQAYGGDGDRLGERPHAPRRNLLDTLRSTNWFGRNSTR